MRELVETLVRYLVDSPEEVQVSVVEGQRTLVFELRVAPADVGRVIGRQGRVINAIRTVVKAAAMKDGRQVNVEIIS